ncbi:MAG: hypothetical protein IJ470_03390, partial [Clostridia bacterium]|nr:hypothetical protein [Clostridia bacterium]
PGYEGINELTLSNAAYLSSWKNGAEVELPFDEKEFDMLLSEKIKASSIRNAKIKNNLSGEYKKRWQVIW